MAIDVIKLNNNISQLDAFINDITYRVENDELAVSQVTSRLEETKFPENKAVKENMAKLKAWQSKSKEEKEAGAEMAHLSYILVLHILADEQTMLNKNNQTPKDVAEKNSLEYMTILFNNPNNCINEKSPVTAPASSPASVISSAVPTKRPTLNPIGVAIVSLVLHVLVLLCAVSLDLIFSARGVQHVVPFLLNMPGLAIIGGIIGALSIADGLRAHIDNRVKARQAGQPLPSLPVGIDQNVAPSLRSPAALVQEENESSDIFGHPMTSMPGYAASTRSGKNPAGFDSNAVLPSRAFSING